MLEIIVQSISGVIGGAMVLGSLLCLSRHPHWFVRGWEFPRVQIAVIVLVCGAIYAAVNSEWGWFDKVLLAAMGACFVWQLVVISRYTPLWPVSVKNAENRQAGREVRMVISNVLMQNEERELWKRTVLAEDPDLILAVETDETWCGLLRGMQDDYPHGVFQPQDNMYGMAMISRLELIDPEVKYIVDEEYPSIHSGVRMPSGDTFLMIGAHPPPPEPIRDKDSKERDAELVILGRDYITGERPTVIAGDLNDVAWSHSSRLFKRLSGMLDIRIGRGLFNTWDANSYWQRAPLDHVYHTDEFRLVDFHLLDYVGSDHFPMFAHLSFEPTGARKQDAPELKQGDQDEAAAKIDLQQKDGGVLSMEPAP